MRLLLVCAVLHRLPSLHQIVYARFDVFLILVEGPDGGRLSLLFPLSKEGVTGSSEGSTDLR